MASRQQPNTIVGLRDEDQSSEIVFSWPLKGKIYSELPCIMWDFCASCGMTENLVEFEYQLWVLVTGVQFFGNLTRVKLRNSFSKAFHYVELFTSLLTISHWHSSLGCFDDLLVFECHFWQAPSSESITRAIQKLNIYALCGEVETLPPAPLSPGA